MGKAADWLRKNATHPLTLGIAFATEEGREELKRHLSFIPKLFMDKQPDNWARLHDPHYEFQANGGKFVL
jgi:hypothetical protein